LWEVVRTVLLLSHGQAQVERGFSTSKELMDVNIKQRTLVAKRAIVDYVQLIGGLWLQHVLGQLTEHIWMNRLRLKRNPL